MALRKLRIYNDQILRKKCRKVEVVDDKIKQNLNDMADTMYDLGNCVGLAGPQVGLLKRIIVIDMGDKLYKLVNPEIISKEGTQEVTEGCMSIPDKMGKLIRPAKVTVKALNENGEEIKVTGTEALAKCLCHEIDHLDGKLFIDFVTEYL